MPAPLKKPGSQPIAKTNTTPVIDTSSVYNGQHRKTIASIKGTRWTTKALYVQDLKTDDIPRPLDLGLNPTDQSYKKYIGYDFMLDGQLSFSNDPTTGNSIITGSGYSWPGIVINKFDHFIATIPDGTECIFMVRSVEELDYRKSTVCRIDFELWSQNTPAFEDNLNLKTVEIWYFNSNTNTVSKKPPVNEQTRSAMMSMLATLYYDFFYHKSTMTFIRPGATEYDLIYDRFISKFFIGIIHANDRARLPKVTLYNWESAHYERELSTILDLLMNVAHGGLNFISKQVRLVSASQFASNRIYTDAFTNKIDTMVWPVDRRTLKEKVVPDITTLTPEYYIFSEHYYNEARADMSDLEVIVFDFVSKIKYPKWDVLVPIVNTGLTTLTKEKLFYFIPIYYYLVKYARE